MTHKKTLLFTLIFVFIFMLPILSSCSTTITEYSHTTPKFDMATFFNGPLTAYGMVQDRSGKVIRRFEADLVGSWQGGVGILEEDFLYDDGEEQRRVWYLKKHDGQYYSGTADDVVGSASGQAQGFAFNWHYTMAINVDDKVWNIDLDDWIYQLNETRLINRTVMTKWGFKVGEITLIIEKH